MPTFASQDVVSAAGGQCVHCFQANARLHQGALQNGRGEIEFTAAAEDHEFGAHLSELLEMLRGELGECNAMPIEALAMRADHDGMLHFLLLGLPIHEVTDTDPTRAVASDDGGICFIGL